MYVYSAYDSANGRIEYTTNMLIKIGKDKYIELTIREAFHISIIITIILVYIYTITR